METTVKLIKKTSLLIAVAAGCLLTTPGRAAKTRTVSSGGQYMVVMRTSMGRVKFRLFNDTPRHRDNFVSLAEKGFYNNLLFHRVIRDFMIQTGDPESIEASQVKVYGGADAGYKLESEIVPHHFHKRGAVAAAREGDEANPERRSSGSQFYIVVGREQNDSTLTAAREKIAAGAADPAGARITPEREKVYRKRGGTPHLDGSYTIFGEVVSGMRTVKRISEQPTDFQDRPKKEDIYIKTVKLKLVKERKRH
ncbi:MAG: peptidylprolyl isomerase [Rikenella sp.]|nr:peptidylprolyl isomerase [Rikenella sp.]